MSESTIAIQVPTDVPQFNPDKQCGEQFKPENGTQAGLVWRFLEFTSEGSHARQDDLCDKSFNVTHLTTVHPETLKHFLSMAKVKHFLERFDVRVS